MPRRRTHFRFLTQTRPRGDYRLAAGPRRLVSQYSRANDFCCRRSEVRTGDPDKGGRHASQRRSVPDLRHAQLRDHGFHRDRSVGTGSASARRCQPENSLRTDGPTGYETVHGKPKRRQASRWRPDAARRGSWHVRHASLSFRFKAWKPGCSRSVTPSRCRQIRRMRRQGGHRENKSSDCGTGPCREGEEP